MIDMNKSAFDVSVNSGAGGAFSQLITFLQQLHSLRPHVHLHCNQTKKTV